MVSIAHCPCPFLWRAGTQSLAAIEPKPLRETICPALASGVDFGVIVEHRLQSITGFLDFAPSANE
jgi:hypothetical protein